MLFRADTDFAIVAEPGQIHSHMPGMPCKCLRLSHALCVCCFILRGNDGCSSLPCIWHLKFRDKKNNKTRSIKDVNWTEVNPCRPITTDDWSCPVLPGRFIWDQVLTVEGCRKGLACAVPDDSAHTMLPIHNSISACFISRGGVRISVDGLELEDLEGRSPDIS